MPKKWLSARLLMTLSCLALCAAACNNTQKDAKDHSAHSDSSKTIRVADSSTTHDSTGVLPDSSLRKEVLIRELQHLQKIIASRDKKQIATLFQFPVPDTVMNPFVDDKAFDSAWRANNNLLSQELFDKYFDKMAQGWDLDEFDKVFRHLDPTLLRKSDRLEFKAIKKKEPCYNQYIITYKHDSIVGIMYGVNSNKDYVPKKGESDNDDTSLCEHDTYWRFVFDGRHLKLLRQQTAD
jgi:hypothetical protein